MATDDGGGIYGEYDMCAPRSAFIAARDQWRDKPGDGGWLSPNEIRRMENLPEIEGGDEYLSPLNMQRIGEGEGE
ncbi:hypothetical protein [Cereibacter sphaeroides]|uniref:hypothetical protein n=1 Tax=Cereibacter sphaeroides TaxID=1063 RepID=UPI001E28615F|nr:hypothetical protein [Cereibacter sphaeroides]